MNVTSLCLNCRHISKFKLSWLGATEAPTQDNYRDVDAGWFLLEIITFISVVISIIWQGDLCWEDFWKVRYWFKLRMLISGVVDYHWPFWGLIKGTLWLPKDFFLFFHFLNLLNFLRRKSKTTLAERINICISKGKLYKDNRSVYKLTSFKKFQLWKI